MAGDGIQDFAIAPDGTRVVYLADEDFPFVYELYSVPIVGGLVRKLNIPLAPDRDVFDFTTSPDSFTVVYRADQDLPGVAEIYGVPIAGGPVTKLNGTLTPGGNVGEYAICPDGSTVVYIADQETDEVFELYSVPLAGGPETKLSEPLIPGGDVTWFACGSDSSTVFFLADAEEDEIIELWAVPTAGGPPLRVHDPLESSVDVLDARLLDDPGLVLYRTGNAVLEHSVELYSAVTPVDPDGDGIPLYCDLCPDQFDPGQGDADLDGVGDSCDNCPSIPNPDQTDSNSDGTGDACTPDTTPPSVDLVLPPDGAQDVALGTEVTALLSEPIDPLTAHPGSVVLMASGVKVPGRVLVAAGGVVVSFDPAGPLQPDTDYVFWVNENLRDPAGNSVVGFLSGFDTTANAGSGQLPADDVGDQHAGATIPGSNADDSSGFSVAVVGDVDDDGVADLVVGAPNADAASLADAGKATLVFGAAGLQANGGNIDAIDYAGVAAGQHAGEAVGRAGDLNDDGVADFAIGAPQSDLAGADAGAVYVVFGDDGLDDLAPATLDLGDLATCATPTLCGTVFLGETTGDLAGYSVAYAGDVNDDGDDDLLIGAPGAAVGGHVDAGKVYLIYGPLSNGTVSLATVGSTTAGLVFHGEAAGDRAGEAVSSWEDSLSGNAIDDLLIGAPGATTLDEFGDPIAGAGHVYAIHGGTSNLDAKAVSGVIDLSRVASGLPDQVLGLVFLGTTPGGAIGRSVAGTVDVDGDGVPDLILGGNGEAWVVPGDTPKTTSGTPTIGKKKSVDVGGLSRPVGQSDALEDFGAMAFTPGDDGDLGDLAVAGVGDVDHDGIEDFVIGSAAADPVAGPDAGRAYIIYGRLTLWGDETLLSDVGGTVSGLVVTGYAAGDALGRSVAGGFDVNADGVDDALVGAPFADSLPGTPVDAGESYVISPVAPEEVVLLLLDAGGGTTNLEWTVPPRALEYNVYRGLAGTLSATGFVQTSNMTQHLCGTRADGDGDGLPDATDSQIPPPGDAFVYLVAAENLTGEGPLGPPGGWPPRVNDLQCP
jgi:hypothetical protein